MRRAGDLRATKEIGMKRLHIHVRVADLERSIQFYSTLFNAAPVKVEPDYAKWMLEDPRVNFAISSRCGAGQGIEHLGIQAEDLGELDQVYGRLQRAGQPVLEEGQTTCCYARSEKSWVADPDGLVWEAFHTSGDATTYGDSLPADAFLSQKLAKEPQPTCCDGR
jgi:catechol 2,3-dioxygenase-like lactoylglutathione lyase family enzyme